MTGVLGIGGDLNRWGAELALAAELVVARKGVPDSGQLGEQYAFDRWVTAS